MCGSLSSSLVGTIPLWQTLVLILARKLIRCAVAKNGLGIPVTEVPTSEIFEVTKVGCSRQIIQIRHLNIKDLGNVCWQDTLPCRHRLNQGFDPNHVLPLLPDLRVP